MPQLINIFLLALSVWFLQQVYVSGYEGCWSARCFLNITSPPNVCNRTVNSSDCSWSSCQRDDWAVVGCTRYNMIQLDQRECVNGSHEYYCCPGSQDEIDENKLTEGIFGVNESDIDYCWRTGCQPNDWAVVGCTHYNLIEKSRFQCDNGYEYFCCPGQQNEIDRSKVKEDIYGIKEPNLKECWWTDCQVDNSTDSGCDQYDRFENANRRCNGGHEYFCCPMYAMETGSITNNSTRAAWFTRVINYLKDLL